MASEPFINDPTEEELPCVQVIGEVLSQVLPVLTHCTSMLAVMGNLPTFAPAKHHATMMHARLEVLCDYINEQLAAHS